MDPTPAADLNEDGIVNVLDVIQLINVIGWCQLEYFFLLLLLFGCDSTSSDETLIFSGITETDTNGNMIGNIDSDDWCPFI